MNINGINRIQGAAPLQRLDGVNKKVAPDRMTNQRDEMNVRTSRNVGLSNADGGAEIRADLVNSIRAQIADGTYYTDEKFEIALNRMFETFE